MDFYTVSQWLLFFYIYCFIGWVWESGYVSVKEKRLVNRGFMHGPFLPIYGSGAIVILFATLPVKGNIVLVYVFGMLSATVLEYCTGACMEGLFKVRYWDYSELPLNLNGHICFFVSLGWGVFSIVLVRFAHLPIEAFVLSIPKTASDITAMLLTIYVTVDFTQSFNEAMDLREMLAKLSESNEQLRRLEKRIEVISAVVGDDLQKRAENKAVKIQSKKERIEVILNRTREEKTRRLAGLEEQANLYFAKRKPGSDEEKSYMAELNKLRQRLHMQTDKEYYSLRRILERNPGAVSRLQSDALKEIKEMFHMKK
ncbi:MAG TPA: hypothetical protein PLU43_07230 [Lachnospiraceae bacterium]|nr:hypothetical protein [Lachnospiraceae bacterium]